ncbi:MAG: helix-turn-helix domain-containing protein [Alphaproteobacteria bacterium]|nr:MAG: hypothetical protein B6I23_01360 [Rickettsiaceae bacterium 4572_127]
MQIVQKILPTPDMIRSARGYLNWSQAELGDRCGLSKVSLVGIESQRQHPNMQTLKRIATVFWEQGLTFLPQGGFSIDNQIIKVFEGLEGLKKFFKQVYIVAREKGGEFLVSGADEESFRKIMEKNNLMDDYVLKMQKLFEKRKISYKVIISESEKNNNNTIYADYASYKWLKNENFGNVPFYVYGENLAIFLWKKNNVKIVTIKEKELVEAYKKTFNILWKQGQDI